MLEQQQNVAAALLGWADHNPLKDRRKITIRTVATDTEVYTHMTHQLYWQQPLEKSSGDNKRGEEQEFATNMNQRFFLRQSALPVSTSHLAALHKQLLTLHKRMYV